MKIINKILDLIYPPKCVFCHKLLKDGEKNDICSECEREIRILRLDESKQSFKNIIMSIAPFYYEGKVKDALHRYKFGGKSFYCKKFAKYMYIELMYSDITPDIITWVPLSRKRLRSRGYGQAKLLADEISKMTGIECRRLLIKKKNVRAQSGMGNYSAREKNIKGAYVSCNDEFIRGKKILLIDDIVTTGATMSECAGVLLRASAAGVYTLTAARAKD